MLDDFEMKKKQQPHRTAAEKPENRTLFRLDTSQIHSLKNDRTKKHNPTKDRKSCRANTIHRSAPKPKRNKHTQKPQRNRTALFGLDTSKNNRKRFTEPQRRNPMRHFLGCTHPNAALFRLNTSTKTTQSQTTGKLPPNIADSITDEQRRVSIGWRAPARTEVGPDPHPTRPCRQVSHTTNPRKPFHFPFRTEYDIKLHDDNY